MKAFIKAVSVKELSGGIFEITLPEREMTDDERTAFRRVVSMFPHIAAHVEESLETFVSQEALMSSIPHSSEIADAQDLYADREGWPRNEASTKAKAGKPSKSYGNKKLAGLDLSGGMYPEPVNPEIDD